MKVLSVVGFSGSGKTTTIEKIIRELGRRNYSVGSIKDIHYEKFTMETEGSNTHRHKQAGAELVTARGYNESNILFPGRLPVGSILKFYKQDYVIMEGVEDYPSPRIICARSIEEIEAKMDPLVLAISGVISNELRSYGLLPVFNPLEDTDAQRLVDYIEEKVSHCDCARD